MNTYGDLVTLLLTFFVLLYSFSSIDAAKWQELVMALSGSEEVYEQGDGGSGNKDGGGGTPTTVSGIVSIHPYPSPTPMPVLTFPVVTRPTEAPTPTPTSASTTVEPTVPVPTPVPVSAGIYDEIASYIAGTSLAGAIQVAYDPDQVTVRLIASILFEPGTDRLLPEATAVLEGVAGIVLRHSGELTGLRTEGHTDGITPPEGDIQSKWDLAGRRAAHVLEFLVPRCGVDESIVYTIGYGSAYPVASDETEAGREQNNRVDVVLST